MPSSDTRPLQGVLLVIAAVALFACFDTGVKIASALAPVGVVVWARYLFQVGVTAVTVLPRRGRALLRTERPGLQLLRGLCLLSLSVLAFFSLQVMPVGEFTAIVMLSPLAATALAAWFLKDHVTVRRWLLMAIGLLGVLLVVRPGGQVFSWALLFPVVLVSTYAAFQVLTSRLSGEESPYTTHFYTGLTGTLLMVPVAALHWDTAALLAHWPWFMALGFFGTFGHLMLIWAFMRAPAMVLTPYLYAQIAFATLFGWVFFRHVPDGWAWLGIAVIAASGVGNAVLSVYELRKARGAMAHTT